jgi:hypothetical protein
MLSQGLTPNPSLNSQAERHWVPFLVFGIKADTNPKAYFVCVLRFQFIVPKKWKNHKPVCIHLAGTGDHVSYISY